MAEYTVAEKSKEYIPEWDGNQERDPAEQIVATLRYLPNEELSKCYETTVNSDGNVVMKPNFANAVKYGVEHIANLVVNGKPIEDGKALAKVKAFTMLFLELGQEVIIMNARVDTKNS